MFIILIPQKPLNDFLDHTICVGVREAGWAWNCLYHSTTEKFQQGFNTATQPSSGSFSPPQGSLNPPFLSLPVVLSKTMIFSNRIRATKLVLNQTHASCYYRFLKLRGIFFSMGSVFSEEAAVYLSSNVLSNCRIMGTIKPRNILLVYYFSC